MPNQEKNQSLKVGDIVTSPIQNLGFICKKKDGIDVKLSKLQIQKTLISAIKEKFEVDEDEFGIQKISGDIEVVNKQAIITKITPKEIKAIYLKDGNAFLIKKEL